LNLFNHHFIDVSNNRLYLDRYRNQPFLVVNIATDSPFVPQLARLQQVYSQHQQSGLEILAVPCTDFDEESRDEDGIAEFLRTEYPVNFLVTARCAVTGRGAHALFIEMLQEHGNAMLPRGTFHKYLFDRRGELVENWPPTVLPDDPALVHSIERYLSTSGF